MCCLSLQTRCCPTFSLHVPHCCCTTISDNRFSTKVNRAIPELHQIILEIAEMKLTDISNNIKTLVLPFPIPQQSPVISRAKDYFFSVLTPKGTIPGFKQKISPVLQRVHADLGVDERSYSKSTLSAFLWSKAAGECSSCLSSTEFKEWVELQLRGL